MQSYAWVHIQAESVHAKAVCWEAVQTLLHLPFYILKVQTCVGKILVNKELGLLEGWLHRFGLGITNEYGEIYVKVQLFTKAVLSC